MKNRRWGWVASVVLAILVPAGANAQVWLPARGEGGAFFGYEFFDGQDHLFSTDIIDGATSRGYTAEGNRMFMGDTFSQSFVLGVDYGIRDRLAVTANLTYVAAKYEGNAPGNLEVDDGDYHGGIQDASVRFRAMVLTHPVVVTPFVGVAFPLRTYASSGHAAPGRGITEFQTGLGIGRHLDPLISDAYFSSGFTYGLNEKVNGSQLWRTSFDAEVGYFIVPRFSVQAIGTALWTHGGLEWVSSDPNAPCGHCDGAINFHLGTANARYTRIGGGFSWAVRNNLQLTLGALTTVWGENVDDANYFFSGIGMGFRTPFAPDLDAME